MAVTRVVVAGASRPHAEALGQVLGHQPDVEVVGVALSAAQAARLADEQSVDLVVAERDLLGEDDWARLRDELNGRNPALVLLARDDSEAQPEGADVPVVARDEPLDAVLAAVRAGRETNGTQFGPSTAEGGLTRREQSVLELLGQALPPKQVAHELGISVHTCRGYVKTILAKLDSHSILEAVLEGQRRGLLPPGAPRSLP